MRSCSTPPDSLVSPTAFCTASQATRAGSGSTAGEVMCGPLATGIHPHALPGGARGVRRDGREVDVRPARHGDPPPRHRARRIQARGLAEGADRLGVHEGKVEDEALIEVAL